jgi:hypothetical protein
MCQYRSGVAVALRIVRHQSAPTEPAPIAAIQGSAEPIYSKSTSHLRGPQFACRQCAPFASGARLANLNLTRVTSLCKLRILGMGRKPQKNDSLPGSLDMLILRTLSRRDLHGYGIVQFIQQSSDNELLVEEGSLYPALQRLGATRLDRGCLGGDAEQQAGEDLQDHGGRSQTAGR